MSAYDDITEGLDEINRSAFVSGSTKGSYKQKYRPEYDRVQAYLGGGALPSPFPTTLMGTGLTKVERGRRALVPDPPPPPPPPSGTAIDTFEVTVDGAPGPYEVFRQSWAIYTYPLVPTAGSGYGPIAEIRTPQADSANGSWEWWYLYELYVPSSWNSGTEGSIAALPYDPHNVPGDVGWNTIPGQEYGTASSHMRFTRDDLVLQHEYNSPNEFTVVADLPRDRWHSIAVQFILGRADGSVPASGHPNGGRGRTRIYVNGPLVFQVDPVNSLQKNLVTGNVQKRASILQGVYTPSVVGPHTVRFTAGRFGKTLAQALSAQGVGVLQQIYYAGQPAIDDHHWTPLTGSSQRTTGQFIAPQV